MKIIIGLLCALAWGGLPYLAYAQSNQTAITLAAALKNIQQQDWARAEIQLLLVIKQDFKHIEARYKLAQLAEKREDFRLANKRYMMVLFIDKTHLLALKGWARVAEKLGSNDMLIAYRRIIKQEPLVSFWRLKVAQYYMANQPLSAKRYIKDILNINPDHRQALELMITYQKKHTLTGKAYTYEQRLRRLGPVGIQGNKLVMNRLQINRLQTSRLQTNTLQANTLHTNNLQIKKVDVDLLSADKRGVVDSKLTTASHGRHKATKLVKDAPVQADTVVFNHYRLAAIQGRAQDQLMLGLLYHEGRGVSKNEQMALALIEQAALQGNRQAQLSLALMLYTGSSIKEDKNAVQWFKRAANQGLADAQFSLGLIYATNIRFKNDSKAMMWWKLAARQHHLKAEHNLGVMKQLGRDLPSNTKQTLHWIQQEANGKVISQHPYRQ